MTWRYVATKEHNGRGGEHWTIRDHHDRYGYTAPVIPLGDTLEELREALRRMLADTDKFLDLTGDGDSLTLRDTDGETT